jgi:hypothetical protein
MYGADNLKNENAYKGKNVFLNQLEHACGDFSKKPKVRLNLYNIGFLLHYQKTLEDYSQKYLALRSVLLAFPTPFPSSLHSEIIELDGASSFHEKEPKANTHQSAIKVSNFKNMLDTMNIKLLFVSAPSKNQKEADVNIAPFHQELNDLSVWNINLGAKNPFGIAGFYKTDHHWKLETALWAAHEVSIEINDKLKYKINTSLYEMKNLGIIYLVQQGRCYQYYRTI